jgi:hypothetical protein
MHNFRLRAVRCDFTLQQKIPTICAGGSSDRHQTIRCALQIEEEVRLVITGSAPALISQAISTVIAGLPKRVPEFHHRIGSIIRILESDFLRDVAGQPKS